MSICAWLRASVHAVPFLLLHTDTNLSRCCRRPCLNAHLHFAWECDRVAVCVRAKNRYEGVPRFYEWTLDLFRLHAGGRPVQPTLFTRAFKQCLGWCLLTSRPGKARLQNRICSAYFVRLQVQGSRQVEAFPAGLSEESLNLNFAVSQTSSTGERTFYCGNQTEVELMPSQSGINSTLVCISERQIKMFPLRLVTSSQQLHNYSHRFVFVNCKVASPLMWLFSS